MEVEVYDRAIKFLPWNLENKVLNSNIFPYWTSNAVYYFQENLTDKILLRVDILTGKKENVLNYQELIHALQEQLNEVNLNLPLDKFTIEVNPIRLIFNFRSFVWSYDLKKCELVKSEKISSKYLRSPDNKWDLWIKDHNLYLTNLIDNISYPLTNDGSCYYDYASSPETNTRAITNRLKGIETSPIAVWSFDSKKIVTYKLNQKNVSELQLLQNAPSSSQRPIIHSYRMSFSGDSVLPLAELILFDIEQKKAIPIDFQPLLSPYLTPLEFKWVWWSSKNKKIYFLYESRGSKQLSLCVADAITGITEELITESAETYIEPSQHFMWPHQIIILENTDEIIWLSEKSGYSHLYLYEKGNKVPKQAITYGMWCVREVHHYDLEENWLYFTATGYDNEIDPYFKQLFRCRLNGSEIQCLTIENAHHSISISPAKNCFLDTYSTINTAPNTVLKSMNGEIICHIETADINELFLLNWVPPKRFCVKARDGITPIYGNMYFPTNFDPSKKYPIIDLIVNKESKKKISETMIFI